MIYEFSLVMSRPQVTDEQIEVLYQAGFDDSTISTSRGTTSIDLTRFADSLELAIRVAIGQANNAGLTVAVVEIDAAQFVYHSIDRH